MNELRHPPPACKNAAECKAKQLTSAFPTFSVFFWEVCFFAQVCKNRDTLFRLEVGESFHCDLDNAALLELGTILD